MGLIIKGLHIEEIIIDLDGEEEEPKKEESSKPAPKTAPKKTGRKPIDKGKVGALRKAGWTIAEIADEMKCSQLSVRKILEEMKS